MARECLSYVRVVFSAAHSHSGQNFLPLPHKAPNGEHKRTNAVLGPRLVPGQGEARAHWRCGGRRGPGHPGPAVHEGGPLRAAASGVGGNRGAGGGGGVAGARHGASASFGVPWCARSAPKCGCFFPLAFVVIAQLCRGMGRKCVEWGTVRLPPRCAVVGRTWKGGFPPPCALLVADAPPPPPWHFIRPHPTAARTRCCL
jgi:hypothetical protein